MSGSGSFDSSEFVPETYQDFENSDAELVYDAIIAKEYISYENMLDMAMDLLVSPEDFDNADIMNKIKQEFFAGFELEPQYFDYLENHELLSYFPKGAAEFTDFIMKIVILEKRLLSKLQQLAIDESMNLGQKILSYNDEVAACNHMLPEGVVPYTQYCVFNLSSREQFKELLSINTTQPTAVLKPT